MDVPGEKIEWKRFVHVDTGGSGQLPHFQCVSSPLDLSHLYDWCGFRGNRRDRCRVLEAEFPSCSCRAHDGVRDRGSYRAT